MEKLKNTVILDLDRYNELLEQEKVLESYNENDEDFVIIKNQYNYRLGYDYGIISTDDVLKDLGEKYNSILKKSVPSYEYNELRDKYFDLQKERDKLLEEKESLISTNKIIQHMSVREFKKWRKENKLIL